LYSLPRRQVTVVPGRVSSIFSFLWTIQHHTVHRSNALR